MKKPVIGITSGYVKHNSYMEGVYVHHDYHKAVVAAGGIPIVLPYHDHQTALEQASLCDGIILSGGEDVDPRYYQEDPHLHLGFTTPERDEVEIALIHHALQSRIPILAICRGLQILNVALGGSLIQDLPEQKKNSIQHFQKVPRPLDSHWISIREGSYLHQLFGQTALRVNSLHHQAINRLSDQLDAIAFASDDVIEAVQYKGNSFAIGVQWHPESMAGWNSYMKSLFQDFVSKTKKVLS